jgi:hypothetical protein
MISFVGTLADRRYQASILESMIYTYFLLPSSNDHLFLCEPPRSTCFAAEFNHSHPSIPLDISSSDAETVGKVGLSGRVLLLCDVGAQNIEHGRNLGQDESLRGDDLRFWKCGALGCTMLDSYQKEGNFTIITYPSL